MHVLNVDLNPLMKVLLSIPWWNETFINEIHETCVFVTHILAGSAFYLIWLGRMRIALITFGNIQILEKEFFHEIKRNRMTIFMDFMSHYYVILFFIIMHGTMHKNKS